ncbi:MAG: 16S rRNA (cytosine(967)-C(5))-methyltransferase RsmB, partial [Deltaproteobacteria bacterium]|nr:16S rRNA (cytosine(967)-C(5))-methyltransferase RsmB [Deltaproteobacteria bacterium]
MKQITARALALSILNGLGVNPGFSGGYFDNASRDFNSLNKQDRAFTVHLVQGVLRWKLRLDWVLGQAVRFSFKKIEPGILNILRIALYQIFFMDQVPESAAVNEAVKQAKSTGKPHVSGFVNGILRNICRKKKSITFPDPENNRVDFLSVFYSYPGWLVNKWIRELGQDSAESLLAAGNAVPKLIIRVNGLKIDRQGLIRQLEGEGLHASPTKYSPEGLIVEGLKGPVNNLISFRKGLFQVQGEASQICAHLISPNPGEKILDLCAGLGGKSSHLAELSSDEAFILALDISRAKTLSLLNNSQRLGHKSVYPVVADAACGLSSLFNCTFDKILVDAPCSILGTISRHPDAKWSRQENDILRLSVLQKNIL